MARDGEVTRDRDTPVRVRYTRVRDGEGDITCEGQGCHWQEMGMLLPRAWDISDEEQGHTSEG